MKHFQTTVMMRSIPSKTNAIWQNLVDVKKVYKKLKEINLLYALIHLPRAPAVLNIANHLDERSYGEPLSRSTEYKVEEIAEHQKEGIHN